MTYLGLLEPLEHFFRHVLNGLHQIGLPWAWSVVALTVIVRMLLVPPGTCKYHPSCSQYAIDAIRRHGLVRGSAKAGWRLLRCNPWSHGGFDPVR